VARPREDGNRRALDELKEKRRQEADKAEAELAEARGELEKLRFKCDAAVSRKKLLEDEVKNLKEKIAVLLSKTTNDDKLIAALRSQLEQSKRAPHETNPRVKAKPGLVSSCRRLCPASCCWPSQDARISQRVLQGGAGCFPLHLHLQKIARNRN